MHGKAHTKRKRRISKIENINGQHMDCETLSSHQNRRKFKWSSLNWPTQKKVFSFKKGRDEKWTKTNACFLGLTTLFIGNNLRNEKWRIRETKKLNLENCFLFSSAYIHHPPLLYAISCTYTNECAGKNFIFDC